jgi:folate-dependent phosphoribosylglycinamide formyltransferase PurN
VLARRDVPIEPGDTPATLAVRVQALEPDFFVETLQAIADRRLSIPAMPNFSSPPLRGG